MSGDVHTPTHAGPDGSSFGTTAGAHGIDAQPADKPEVQVGAAFAGGFVVAMVLKKLFNRG